MTHVPSETARSISHIDTQLSDRRSVTNNKAFIILIGERDFDLVIFGSRWVDLHYVNGVSTLYDDWEQKWMMFLLNFNVKTTCGFFGLLLTPTTAGDQLDVVNLIY